MVKVQSDLGAIATAIGKIFDFFKLRISTKEVRDLKDAASEAQKLHRRVWKLSKEVREDKLCNKYRAKFNKKII